MAQMALYEHLTWEEIVEARDRATGIIIPLGAIEQHGPHLPVDTDAFLARELAAAGSINYKMLIAPMIPYGYRSRPQSGGGATFPGTISLSGATFVTVVREILSELIRQGFHSYLMYSWHMENQNFAYEAAYLAGANQPEVKIVVMESPFDSLSDKTMQLLYGTEFPGWPAEHASILETSLMAYLRPELVDLSKAVDDRVRERLAYDVVPPRADLTTRSGVLFRSTLGSATKGRAAFEDIVAGLRSVLDREFAQLAVPT